MTASKNKIKRYKTILRTVNNWVEYLWKKAIGFDDYFEFDIRNFGRIKVRENTLGPFRENFFDNVYLSKFPDSIFKGGNVTVVDIGANIGFFSLAFLSRFPKAQVFAYEPHPYCFKQLQAYQNEFNNYDLNIFPKAVGGQNGTLVLHASKTDGFATMSSIFENENKQERFEVESITLASVIEKQNIKEVDLLKMDCEGSEYPILYNTPDEILTRISAMCIETHQGKNDNENLPALISFLEKKYKIEYLDEGDTGYIWAWK